VLTRLRVEQVLRCLEQAATHLDTAAVVGLLNPGGVGEVRRIVQQTAAELRQALLIIVERRPIAAHFRSGAHWGGRLTPGHVLHLASSNETELLTYIDGSRCHGTRVRQASGPRAAGRLVASFGSGTRRIAYRGVPGLPRPGRDKVRRPPRCPLSDPQPPAVPSPTGVGVNRDVTDELLTRSRSNRTAKAADATASSRRKELITAAIDHHGMTIKDVANLAGLSASRVHAVLVDVLTQVPPQ
jgi:hypothetical protein